MAYGDSLQDRQSPPGCLPSWLASGLAGLPMHERIVEDRDLVSVLAVFGTALWPFHGFVMSSHFLGRWHGNGRVAWLKESGVLLPW